MCHDSFSRSQIMNYPQRHQHIKYYIVLTLDVTIMQCRWGLSISQQIHHPLIQLDLTSETYSLIGSYICIHCSSIFVPIVNAEHHIHHPITMNDSKEVSATPFPASSTAESTNHNSKDKSATPFPPSSTAESTNHHSDTPVINASPFHYIDATSTIDDYYLVQQNDNEWHQRIQDTGCAKCVLHSKT